MAVVLFSSSPFDDILSPNLNLMESIMNSWVHHATQVQRYAEDYY